MLCTRIRDVMTAFIDPTSDSGRIADQLTELFSLHSSKITRAFLRRSADRVIPIGMRGMLKREAIRGSAHWQPIIIWPEESAPIGVDVKTGLARWVPDPWMITVPAIKRTEGDSTLSRALTLVWGETLATSVRFNLVRSPAVVDAHTLLLTADTYGGYYAAMYAAGVYYYGMERDWAILSGPPEWVSSMVRELSGLGRMFKAAMEAVAAELAQGSALDLRLARKFVLEDLIGSIHHDYAAMHRLVGRAGFTQKPPAKAKKPRGPSAPKTSQQPK